MHLRNIDEILQRRKDCGKEHELFQLGVVHICADGLCKKHDRCAHYYAESKLHQVYSRNICLAPFSILFAAEKEIHAVHHAEYGY